MTTDVGRACRGKLHPFTCWYPEAKLCRINTVRSASILTAAFLGLKTFNKLLLKRSLQRGQLLSRDRTTMVSFYKFNFHGLLRSRGGQRRTTGLKPNTPLLHLLHTQAVPSHQHSRANRHHHQVVAAKSQDPARLHETPSYHHQSLILVSLGAALQQGFLLV